MLRCDQPCQDRPASLHLRGPSSRQAPASCGGVPVSHCLYSLPASGPVWPGLLGARNISNTQLAPSQPSLRGQLCPGTFLSCCGHSRSWDPAAAQDTSQVCVNAVEPHRPTQRCPLPPAHFQGQDRAVSRTPGSPASYAPSKCLLMPLMLPH